MIKRMLLALGLGAAMTGGIAGNVRAANHAATISADLKVIQVSDQTTDTDANAPCVTDAATGEQTGDCANSQTDSGAQDNSGTDTGGTDGGD